ncbi:MAG: flagellar biosynthetic protein FliO [Terriglobales bacterium]
MEFAEIHIATDAPANRPGWLAHAAARVRTFWRTVIWRSSISRSSISRSLIWRSLACRIRVRRPRKQLSVSETAALGDRRFVSVIQFERRRFLIGSSPSSVTLLSRLPDECGNGEEGDDLAEKSKG